jgi:MoCo/4Fe-4S cofactor protein with predicted Tat translocation signal
MKLTNAPEFWRTLAEHDGADLHELVGDEFASRLPASPDAVERRSFLKLMAASIAMAGMAGCTRQPAEQIVPYVRKPEEIIPGRPLFYATAMTLGGRATGLLVESHEGRPTKIEGNPLHPASLGATDVFAQAAVLDLYDPDRMQTLTHLGEIRPWSAFLGAVRELTTAQQAAKGANLRFLTESICSPTLAAQMDELLQRFPAAVWHQWDPASEQNAAAGARLAFGNDASVHYAIDRAAVVVSLDADFLSCGAGHLVYSRQFATRRRPESAGVRLYAAESMPSTTGARADHRLPLRPSEIEPLARELAASLGGPGTSGGGDRPRDSEAWLQAVRSDLNAHRGSSLVIAGDGQPAVVHALAHAMNASLGNVGQTVFYTDAIEARPVDQLQSIRDLTTAMNAGQVQALVIIGSNPVYTAPADLRFGDAMSNVPLRIHLSLHSDETSALSHWQVPQAHFLESWSDARAFDGTASIVQPLIAPLYGGRSAHELLAAFGDRPEQSGYDIVRAFWQKQHAGADFEVFWRRSVHDGVIPSTALPPKSVSINSAAFAAAAAVAAPTAPSGIDIAFRNDPTIHDGRFANNAWLQELPKPLTHLTWDNAVLVSPAMLARLGGSATPAFTGGERGQIVVPIVEVRHRGRVVRGAMFPVAGHPDQAITLHMGYGRSRVGHVGAERGFNANVIRTSDGWPFTTGAELAITGETYSLACTQYHQLMEGRDLIRVVERSKMDDRRSTIDQPPSMFPAVEYTGYKWGMAIDLNACTGCNACVISCQAENNIPVVGKAEVLRGREMHWLRVDTYHAGPAENPSTYFQPIPCMHCETAPCEIVCPVGATVHSHEGLNEMVYNRCVGTRYCSNNCPYKVRRFNFFLYQDWETPSIQLQRNPDVTVRSRGVMEKCTYCVQRINEAKIDAENQDRPVRDGEIKTACQSVCPTEAIVFGDIGDPNSRVSKLKAEPRDYALLNELNTKPRTTYLAAITDRNPELDTTVKPAERGDRAPDKK